MGNVSKTKLGPTKMMGNDGCESLVYAILKRTCLDLEKTRRLKNKAKREHKSNVYKLMKKEAELAEIIRNWAEYMDLNGEFLVSSTLEIGDRRDQSMWDRSGKKVANG